MYVKTLTLCAAVFHHSRETGEDGQNDPLRLHPTRAKLSVSLLQNVRLVLKTYAAKFQSNELLFCTATSPLRFMIYGSEVSCYLAINWEPLEH